VKLYTYTKKHSLPRMALRGLPSGASLDHPEQLSTVLENMYGDDEDPKDPNVLLEVDVEGLEQILVVDAEWAYHLLEQGDVKEEDFIEWTDLEKTAQLFGFMTSDDVITPDRITVLGQLRKDFGESADLSASNLDELLAAALIGQRTPLKAFKQALVSRLLRSIFLPQHKLYGKGRQAVMGMRLVKVSA